ncbi:MAG: hypothetical protein ACW99J_19200 [Candidatus Thorarchaeota archaeon]|jgi:hypothetical protein
MSTERWNDKIVRNDDGWGYRVTEGNEGEVVIHYFDETNDGVKDKKLCSLYVNETGFALLDALREKFNEMDSDSKWYAKDVDDESYRSGPFDDKVAAVSFATKNGWDVMSVASERIVWYHRT